jgi:tRNA(Ile)-lysidine synthase
VSRADARKACAALGLPVWEDPHNTDPAYARSRVRAGALPALIAALGPAVVDNLARTAAQLAADNATLDGLAAVALAEARGAGAHTPAGDADHVEGERDAGGQAERPGLALGRQDAGLAVAALAALPPAVRTRVLHAWAKELGAAGGALSHHHVYALDALITDWHGQGPTTLPGGITVARRSGYLVRVSG